MIIAYIGCFRGPRERGTKSSVCFWGSALCMQNRKISSIVELLNFNACSPELPDSTRVWEVVAMKRKLKEQEGRQDRQGGRHRILYSSSSNKRSPGAACPPTPTPSARCRRKNRNQMMYPLIHHRQNSPFIHQSSLLWPP